MERWIDGWVDEWVSGCVGGQISGWVNGLIGEWMVAVNISTILIIITDQGVSFRKSSQLF